MVIKEKIEYQYQRLCLWLGMWLERKALGETKQEQYDRNVQEGNTDDL
jgi:hypothetical protein